uniref:Uncharacterized protein n=1 Tax=uncultured sulfate-reducing bacterium TaxID=153939 RepID=Q3IBS4_9BACT|nr:conserved hypothetical protein [uncultured sulfate-reducing bacterium]
MFRPVLSGLPLVEAFERLQRAASDFIDPDREHFFTTLHEYVKGNEDQEIDTSGKFIELGSGAAVRRYCFPNDVLEFHDERHRFRRRHILDRPRSEDPVESRLHFTRRATGTKAVEQFRRRLGDSRTNRVGKGIVVPPHVGGALFGVRSQSCVPPLLENDLAVWCDHSTPPISQSRRSNKPASGHAARDRTAPFMATKDE